MPQDSMQKTESFRLIAGVEPKLTGTKARFVVALGATEISDIEGMSAAGNTAAARRATPALDATALVLPLENKVKLPSSPLGVTSPVVITRACLSLFEHDLLLVDCGTFIAPDVEHLHLDFLTKLKPEPAKNFSEADALPKELVESLFESGLKLGESGRYEQSVIAECVPGGTTTAQALLRLLSIDGSGLTSSSLPACNHDIKASFIENAFHNIAARRRQTIQAIQEKCQTDPLLAVSLVGDPMQAFAAGFALGASKHSEAVILAGGSQMLAVYALAQRIGETRNKDLNAVVATTPYVALDPHADCPALARLCRACFIASTVRLEDSRHSGLRAYGEGHVKEGVGAGASMVMAALNGNTAGTIIDTIDTYYEFMVS